MPQPLPAATNVSHVHHGVTGWDCYVGRKRITLDGDDRLTYVGDTDPDLTRGATYRVVRTLPTEVWLERTDLDHEKRVTLLCETFRSHLEQPSFAIEGVNDAGYRV